MRFTSKPALLLILLTICGCDIQSDTGSDYDHSIKIRAGMYHDFETFSPSKTTLVITITAPDGPPFYDETLITDAMVIVDSTNYPFSEEGYPSYSVRFLNGLDPGVYKRYSIEMQNYDILQDSVFVHNRIIKKTGVQDTIYIENSCIVIDSLIQNNIDSLWVSVEDELSQIYAKYVVLGKNTQIDIENTLEEFDLLMVYKEQPVHGSESIVINRTLYETEKVNISYCRFYVIINR